MCENVQASAEMYFMSVNSMTRKIIEDITSIRGSYSDWNSKDYEEQCRILGEKILQSRAKCSYEEADRPKTPEPESFPKLAIKCGAKYIFDDENGQGKRSGCSWRDEHSAPFMWESKSQLDLTIADLSGSGKPASTAPNTPATTLKADGKNQLSSVQNTPHKPRSRNQDNSDYQDNESSDGAHLLDESVQDGSTSARGEHSTVTTTTDLSDSCADLSSTVEFGTPNRNDIPRTGFDFLDDW